MRMLLHHQMQDHYLTSADARVKLISAGALLVLVLSYRGMAFPLVVAGLCLGSCLHLGVSPRLILLRFAQPLFIAGMILLLKLFATGHEPLFVIDLAGLVITGYADGLRAGLQIAVRIIGAVSVVALVGFSTTFTEVMAALAWLRVPQSFIEVAMFAWRYLFVLFEDAMVVYHAQKNRLGYAGYGRGLKSFGTLAGALVIKAFDNSQIITTAMVQRGYDGHMPLLKQKPFCAGELIASVLFVAFAGCLWRML